MQGPPPLPPGVDPTYLFNQVMPLVAIVVIAAVGVLVVRVLARTAIGEALAERIRQRTQRRFGGAEDPQRVAALERQVAELQGQVTELAERLDFAERVLAERRERKLGAGQ